MGYTICVLGKPSPPLSRCGTMGIAVLSGVLDSLRPRVQLPSDISSSSKKAKWDSHTPGTVTPAVETDDESVPTSFMACVSREESAARLRSVFPSSVAVIAGGNLDAVKKSDVILLCCKPQIAHTILGEAGMKEALEGKLLISILAGVTISQLTAWVTPTTRVIRAMPNTPCKIREGMTTISDSPPPSPLDRAITNTIFSSIGRVRFLPEKHFDACTALSGSGPAFACIFLEAMADGGVMMGLPRAEALELAAQTLQGAARMVLQGGTHPAQLKDAVTTPGGCTIAGLLAMEDGRVRSTIARAIQIATERASELGQPKKD
ncbi:unnamed protein product [Mycena citricolor]|uniref:Pyrroline-5-carboxylate reductase n=1 Tax=Mycena citricolor TaxID=2018698 RepID=A0AAD2HNY7_9AGAR|nr:unnamed protein product [Mycena citricolor]